MFILSCPVCGVEFEAVSKRRKYCSTRCKDKGKPCKNTGKCTVCGKSMELSKTSAVVDDMKHGSCRRLAADSGAYCGTVTGYDYGCRCVTCCAAKASKNKSYSSAYREEAGVLPSTVWRRNFRESYGYWPQMGGWDWISPRDRRDLYERDSWVCHLCGSGVDRDADPNSDYAPSLDHLVPRSQGGSDDQTNLKTAHRLCNAKRQDRALV